MENKKGNVVVIAIIIVIVAITASVITWLVVSKSQTPVQKEVANNTQPQPTTTQKSTTTAVPLDWKTYTSNTFNASISLPTNWMLIMPYDGSLTDTNEDIFNGDIKYGFLTGVSSPDKKEQITFENGPLDIRNRTCTVEPQEVNNQTVKKYTCPDATINEIPGRYNYEFIDKNLVVVTDKNTATTDKIISLIKFN